MIGSFCARRAAPRELFCGSGISHQGVEEMVHKGQVIGLDVTHRTAHAGEAFAEAEVIRGIRLWWLAIGPVPAAAILEIDHVDAVAGERAEARLEAEIVHAAEALLKNLRPHDCGTDGEDHAARAAR